MFTRTSALRRCKRQRTRYRIWRTSESVTTAMTFRQYVATVRRTGFLGGHDVSQKRVNDWFADDHKREVILGARSAFLAKPPEPEPVEYPREGPSMELHATDDFKADDWWPKLRPQLTDYLRAQRRSKFLVEPLDAEGEKLLKAGRTVRIGSGKFSRKPKKCVETSDFLKGYELLRKLKGRLEGVAVIFGGATDYQMKFKPHADGTMMVSCESAVGADGLKATLSKGRRLWDVATNKPCAEYRAIEDATRLKDQMAEVVKGTTEMPSAKEIHIALTNLLESLRKNPKRLALASEQYKKFSEETNK